MLSLPWWIAAAIVLPGTVALVIVASRASRRSGNGEAVVGMTMWIARIWVVVCIAGAVIAGLAPLITKQVEVTFPVQTFWPALPEGASIGGTSATLTGGGFTQATALVAGLGWPARACLAASQLLWWLVPGAIAALIAIACRRLLGGKPFAPAVARTALLTAVVVALGGVAAQVLGDIASSMAAHEVLGWTSGAYDPPSGAPVDPGFDLGDYVPRPGLMIEFPFWPIAAGLAFAALAAIFRHGGRLQRDAEGLV